MRKDLFQLSPPWQWSQVVGSFKHLITLHPGSREPQMHPAAQLTFLTDIVQDSSQGMVSPSVGGSPATISTTKMIHHRHTQRPATQVTPDSVKLTITSNHQEQLKPHLEIFTHHFSVLICLSQSVNGPQKLLWADTLCPL